MSITTSVSSVKSLPTTSLFLLLLLSTLFCIFLFQMYTVLLYYHLYPNLRLSFYLPIKFPPYSFILPVCLKSSLSSLSCSQYCPLSFFDCICLSLFFIPPLVISLYPLYPLTSVCPSLSLSLSLHPVYILADIAVWFLSFHNTLNCTRSPLWISVLLSCTRSVSILKSPTTKIYSLL